ncbi:3-oxoacyl-ACP reductase [Rhodosalinus halophilus]|uniref:3-oxoacyl-ACP reductase n=1 Tax=Rhodosalinus halophilus TaxID=2259333 RepID=A0A365UA48_9RHOB|nr:SDR family NAD(P)-dependent oxidoreductase [Rhodosalinus halophilus]RBI84963.1 3-oxoacyl-ACP reductase [Rhodosalinus halophilus]
MQAVTHDLSGQVAVVTGGAQGIGLAVARRLHASGATASLWDLDGALAEEAAAELGDRAEGRALDVTDPQATEAVAKATAERLGRIDILVASAGIAGMNAPVVDYPVEEFHRVVAINLHGVFHSCRAVLPHMAARGYGRVVNIASVAGKEGNPNAGAYSASKAGVMALTKTLGKEFADTDIAVNCVTPAAARTRIFDQMSQTHIDFMLSKIPRGRFLEVDEAANMIVWLCSPENSFTTGAVFDLSGGRATY